MMKRLLLSILAILVVIPALAQQPMTVSGTVRDENGEVMVLDDVPQVMNDPDRECRALIENIGR